MEVKASSIYDFKALQALIRRSMSGKSEPRKNLIIKLVVCFVMELLLLGIVFESRYKKIVVILLVLYIAFMLLLLYRYFLFPKVQYKNMGNMIGQKNEYIFTEEYIQIITTSSQYNGEKQLKYECLYKVVEDKQYIFLFQTKAQAFPVDKSTINEEERVWLQEKLKEKFGKKYILCKG